MLNYNKKYQVRICRISGDTFIYDNSLVELNRWLPDYLPSDLSTEKITLVNPKFSLVYTDPKTMTSEVIYVELSGYDLKSNGYLPIGSQKDVIKKLVNKKGKYLDHIPRKAMKVLITAMKEEGWTDISIERTLCHLNEDWIHARKI